MTIIFCKIRYFLPESNEKIYRLCYTIFNYLGVTYDKITKEQSYGKRKEFSGIYE